MALSCASCGANTFVSPPSTRLFSKARTHTVRGAFQLREVKLTPLVAANDESAAVSQALSRQTSSCCEKETMPPVSDVRVGCACTVILISWPASGAFDSET